jgi:hypothetical protein
MFPQLVIETQESAAGPVSVANPTASLAVGEPVVGGVVRDESYPNTPDQFDAAPPPLLDNPSGDRKRKRDGGKWRRKTYE